MKRSVGIEYKLTVVAIVVLFVLMALTEPDMLLLILTCLAVTGIAIKVEENPPRWLRRSPLSRWLRR
jgi:hypothetical protein